MTAAHDPAHDKPAAGQPAKGSTSTTSGDWDDDEGENWRHAPVAPKDANPLDSLGESVSDAVTGSEADRTPRKKG